jgi:SAM-dependent methyltransferase
MNGASLPSRELLRRQAAWLAPARGRLLRRVHVARRQRVLDLACASGAVTAELVRRCRGQVFALDRSRQALLADQRTFAGAVRVCGDAAGLPFADGTFDLVFCQFALLWLDAAAVLREVHRVLQPAGVLIAIEPDYGGMIEYPVEIATRDVWLAALARAGGDPCLGRKLPGLLAAAGFQPRVDLLDRLTPPAAERFEFLRGLPLSDDEQQTVARAESAGEVPGQVAHLPLLLVTAVKS